MNKSNHLFFSFLLLKHQPFFPKAPFRTNYHLPSIQFAICSSPPIVVNSAGCVHKCDQKAAEQPVGVWWTGPKSRKEEQTVNPSCPCYCSVNCGDEDSTRCCLRHRAVPPSFPLYRPHRVFWSVVRPSLLEDEPSNDLSGPLRL